MKFNLTDKDLNVLKVVSIASGGFTLIVALTMIFSLIQLKTIKPLDNPALLSVKEQYDKDPANSSLAAQVRAMDLMARKAYFSSRWQVATGSYLLLAGAVIFIFCQRLISENEKIKPVPPGSKTEISAQSEKVRKYLLVTASVISVAAIAASFILRSELPDTYPDPEEVQIPAKGAVEKHLNLTRPIFPFSVDRIAVVLQADRDIRLNGMEIQVKILNGRFSFLWQVKAHR